MMSAYPSIRSLKFILEKGFEVHPEHTIYITYCGSATISTCEGQTHIVVNELFINGNPVAVKPSKGGVNKEWQALYDEISEAVAACDNPKSQKAIELPAESDWNEYAEWVTAAPKPAPASNATEVPLMVGITEQHGEVFTHTYEAFKPSGK